MVNNIRNIIFDLGGVLLNINYQRTINAFKELGIINFDDLFSQAKQSNLFNDFETGIIAPSEFRDQLREISGMRLIDQQIDHAWNAMLLDMPPTRVKLLEKVSKNYRTFLLSNTNAIHYPVYNAYMEDEFGCPDLTNLFEKEYLSYRTGMRKPDVEIFDLVINENLLNPDETLFIDDSPQHVHGARKAGLHALWLNIEKNTVCSLFNNDHKLKGIVTKMVRA